MNIKIITDSTADLPLELVDEFGISVVPAYIITGSEIYHDRIGFSIEEFYTTILEGEDYPTTEPPTPEDFAAVYREAAVDTDGIISIHISSKISATYNAAEQGKKLAEVECPIEIIDTGSVSMGLGLLAVNAARKAGSFESFSKVVSSVRRMIPCIKMLGFFDTVKYLARGGRINRVAAFFGAAVNVRPMLTTINGEVEPAGQVYQRSTGIEKLHEFVKTQPGIQEVAIVYSTASEEAQQLAERIKILVPEKQVHLTRMGPVIGAHGGPGAMLIALITDSSAG
jgi:DegV family protein with EDD domain